MSYKNYFIAHDCKSVFNTKTRRTQGKTGQYRTASIMETTNSPATRFDIYIKFGINKVMDYEVRLMEPAVEFVQKLAVKMRAKVLRTIGLAHSFRHLMQKP